MATFTLPELGENVSTAVVSRLLVAVGDTVAKDQPILELETDKATVEVPSTLAGVVTEIRVKAGDKLQPGDVVLSLDAAAAGTQASAGPVAAPAPPVIAAAAVSPVPPPAQTPAAASPRAEVRAPQALPVPVVRALAPLTRSSLLASPSVRRLARELGVDLVWVVGSGPDGRVSQEDVKAYVQTVARQIPASAPASASLPDLARWGPIERTAMSGVRRKTAEHLSQAWAAIPHVTQFDKADITELEALRRRYAPQVEAVGGKLTMTAILVKVLASALQRFPQFNAAVDMETSELVYRRYINVGVAVDTDRGLLVPVVRDVDQKRVADLSVEIQALALKARDRKLTLDDMSGGGISLSNLGGIGGTHFTPIVNWPEVAILGVSRGVTEPMYRKGALEPRLMLPLSLSYDHRAIDGGDGIRFLRFVIESLEHPFLLAF